MSEEESIVKRLLQDEGEFQQKNVVVVITGLMGAGKTTLLHWLFGKTPPPEYESTGTAERPWRALTHNIVDMKGFKVLEPKDMLQLVAIVKKVVPTKSTKAAKVSDPHNIKPPTEDNPTALSKALKQDESSEKSSIGRDEEEDTAALSIKEVAEMIRNNPGKWCAKLELVHMIDTGGQPESLEVLPSVIHNANIVLLVVDLSKSLDECVLPTLHKGGVHPFIKRTLPTTNREMIEQLAQAMAGRSGSRVLVIATHTDLIPPQALPEELDKINQFVNEVLPHDAIFPNTDSKTVFDMAFSPHEPPEGIKLESIRECIKDEINKMKQVPVPVSFVLFESEAMNYLSEKRMSGERLVDVMELKECLEIGNKLSMSPDVVKAALKYFHDNNILLYFKEVGSGLVFIDPKALISFVNNMVTFSYRIREEENLFLTKAARSALKEGTITREIWQHRDVTSNFVPDIFEESHAKTIFMTLYIIASRSFALDQSKPSTEAEKDEYIMMCLLPRLSQEEVQCWLRKFVQTKPLFINFGKGYPPDWKLCCSPCGSFGSTIACLISKFNWKICTNDDDDEQPECLYHNIVMLRPNKMSSNIALVNRTKRFEAYVDLKETEQESLPKVRSDLCEAAKEVLQKNLTVAKLSVAEGFECPCKKTKNPCKKKGKRHTQYLTPSNEYICKYGHKETPKNIWMGNGGKGSALFGYYNDIVSLSVQIRKIIFELLSNTVADYWFWKHPLWSYSFPTYPYQTKRYVKLLMGGREPFIKLYLTKSYIQLDPPAPAPLPEFCSLNQECTITEFTPGKPCLQTYS